MKEKRGYILKGVIFCILMQMFFIETYAASKMLDEMQLRNNTIEEESVIDSKELDAYSPLTLISGRSYEITNLSTNEINFGMSNEQLLMEYDYIQYDNLGNINDMVKNDNYGFTLGGNHKIRIKSDKTITFYIEKDYFANINIDISNQEIFYEFIVNPDNNNYYEIDNYTDYDIKILSPSSPWMGPYYDYIIYNSDGNIEALDNEGWHGSTIKSNQKLKVSSKEKLSFLIPYEYRDTLKKVDEPVFYDFESSPQNSYQIDNYTDYDIKILSPSTSWMGPYYDYIIYNSDGNIEALDNEGWHGSTIKSNQRLKFSSKKKLSFLIPYEYRDTLKKVNEPVFYDFKTSPQNSYEINNYTDYDIKVLSLSTGWQGPYYDYIVYDSDGNIGSLGTDGWSNQAIKIDQKFKVSGKEELSFLIPYEYRDTLKKVNEPVFYDFKTSPQNSYEINNYTGYDTRILSQSDPGAGPYYDYILHNSNGTIDIMGSADWWGKTIKGKQKLKVSSEEELLFLIPYEHKDYLKKVSTPVFYKFDLQIDETYDITNLTEQGIEIQTDSDIQGKKYSFRKYNLYGKLIDEQTETWTSSYLGSNESIEITNKSDEVINCWLPYDQHEELLLRSSNDSGNTVKVNSSGQVARQIGQFVISADIINEIEEGILNFEGNVSINNVIKFDGKLTADIQTLTLEGNGLLYMESSSPTYHGTLDLLQGEFSLDGRNAILNKLISIKNEFKIAGLGVKIQDFKFITGGVVLSGELSLPKNIIGTKGQTKINVDEIKVVNGKIYIGAALKLPDITLAGGGFQILDGKIAFNSEKNTFSGEATVKLPAKFGVKGALGLQRNKLERVGLGITDANIAIGTSGLFVQQLYGELQGIAQPPLKATAKTSITAGPKVGSLSFIEASDLSLSVTNAGEVGGEGSLKIIDTIKLASAGFKLYRLEEFKTWGNINVLDTLKGNTEMGISKDEVYGKGTVSASIPKDIWLVGGLELAEAGLSISTKKIQASAKVAGVSVGADYDFLTNKLKWTTHASKAYSIRVKNGKSRIISSSNYRNIPIEYSLDTFEIVDGQESVLINLDLLEGNPNFKIIDPNGNEVERNDQNYVYNSINHNAFYILENPTPGVWTYTLDDSSISEYEVEVVDMVPDSEFSITTNLDQLESQSIVTINWDSNDLPNQVISLYYEDLLNENIIGKIVTNLSASDQTYSWDMSELSSGKYRVYAVVDGEMGISTTVESETVITFENPIAPKSPEIISAIAHNGNIKINWANEELQDIAYNIYISDEFGVEEVISVGNVDTYELTNLEFDQTYHISISTTKDYIAGSKSEEVEIYVPKPIPPVVKLDWPNQSNINQDYFMLSGEIESGSVGRILVNDNIVVEGLKNTFEYQVPLEFGINEVQFIAEKENGDLFTEMKSFRYDETAPQLIISNLSDKNYIDDSEFEVIGHAEPMSKVKINGKRIEIGEDGGFKYNVPLVNGVNQISITSEDYAGNISLFEGEIYSNTLKLIDSYPAIENGVADTKIPYNLNFNSPIHKGSQFDQITLISEHGDEIDLQIEIKESQLIINHELLEPTTQYTLVIPCNSVVNEFNIGLAEDLKIVFSTMLKTLDITNDNLINQSDLYQVAEKYNIIDQDVLWDELYDFNGDKIIDLYDIVLIASEIKED